MNRCVLSLFHTGITTSGIFETSSFEIFFFKKNVSGYGKKRVPSNVVPGTKYLYDGTTVHFSSVILDNSTFFGGGSYHSVKGCLF